MSVLQAPEDMIRDRIQNWEMPKVGIGDLVVFFQNYTDPRTARPGEVVEVSRRSISLIEKGAGAMASWRYEVHHISDPLLEASVDVRAYGAWDYSDQTKRFLQLEKGVALLKERVEELETKPKGK